MQVETLWQEQWRAVMRGFMALGRCYSGQPSDPDMSLVMTVFCRDCYQLASYLEQDPAVPSLVRQAVRAHVAESPFIILAGSIANPQYVGQTTIHTVSEYDPPRTILRVEWDNPDGSTGSDDALDIAVRTVGEWRTFIARHGLATSTKAGPSL